MTIISNQWSKSSVQCWYHLIPVLSLQCMLGLEQTSGLHATCCRAYSFVLRLLISVAALIHSFCYSTIHYILLSDVILSTICVHWHSRYHYSVVVMMLLIHSWLLMWHSLLCVILFYSICYFLLPFCYLFIRPIGDVYCCSLFCAILFCSDDDGYPFCWFTMVLLSVVHSVVVVYIYCIVHLQYDTCWLFHTFIFVVWLMPFLPLLFMEVMWWWAGIVVFIYCSFIHWYILYWCILFCSGNTLFICSFVVDSLFIVYLTLCDQWLLLCPDLGHRLLLCADDRSDDDPACDCWWWLCCVLLLSDAYHCCARLSLVEAGNIGLCRLCLCAVAVWLFCVSLDDIPFYDDWYYSLIHCCWWLWCCCRDDATVTMYSVMMPDLMMMTCIHSDDILFYHFVMFCSDAIVYYSIVQSGAMFVDVVW